MKQVSATFFIKVSTNTSKGYFWANSLQYTDRLSVYEEFAKLMHSKFIHSEVKSVKRETNFADGTSTYTFYLKSDGMADAKWVVVIDV